MAQHKCATSSRRSTRNPKRPQGDFDRLVHRVAQLTDQNAHTESVLLIAEELFTQNKRLVAALKGILAIEAHFGYLPEGAYQTRMEIWKQMAATLKTQLTPARWRALHAAL